MESRHRSPYVLLLSFCVALLLATGWPPPGAAGPAPPGFFAEEKPVPLDDNALRGLMRSASTAERITGIAGLVRKRAIAPAEVMAFLEKEGPDVRQGVFTAMEDQPAPWAAVVLRGLDDRKVDVLPLLKKLAEDKAVDVRAASERLGDLYRSPHAYLRRRAAEGMFYVAPDSGRQWLKEELAYYRSVTRGYAYYGSGSEAGFGGRVKALLEPQKPKPELDPYKTQGDPVVFPPDTLKPEIHALPYQEQKNYLVRFLNNTKAALRLYPNYGGSLSFDSGDETVDMTEEVILRGFSRISGRPRAVQTVEPGDVVFYDRVSIPDKQMHSLRAVEVNFSFILPGQRKGVCEVRIPADQFPKIDDLAALEAILSMADKHSWAEDLIGREGYLSAPVDLSRLPPEAKRKVFDHLVAKIERVGKAGPDATGRSQADRLVERLSEFQDFHTTELCARLLRLPGVSAGPLPRILRHEVVVPAAGNGLSTNDPALALRVAQVAIRKSLDFIDYRAKIVAAVERWLGSKDPSLRRAALTLGMGREAQEESPRLMAAVSTALKGDNPEELAIALRILPDLMHTPDPDVYARAFAMPNEEVRSAAVSSLKQLYEARRNVGPPFARETLYGFYDRLAAELKGRYKAYLSELGELVDQSLRTEETPFLVDRWKKTGGWAMRPLLADRGYDFDSPVLKKVMDHPILSRLFRTLGGTWLVDSELRRLSEHPPEPPGGYYSTLLAKGMRQGYVTSSYCLPLALEQDPESLRLLELACDSPDDVVLVAAAWCVYVRSPEKGRPLVERAARELPPEPDLQEKQLREEHTKLMREMPPWNAEVRPLPPQLDVPLQKQP